MNFKSNLIANIFIIILGIVAVYINLLRDDLKELGIVCTFLIAVIAIIKDYKKNKKSI